MEAKVSGPQTARAEGMDPIGGAWLVRAFGLALVQPLFVRSEIGPRRQTVLHPAYRREVHQEHMRPAATLQAHLTFMLKHEGAHLELLARLFERIDAQQLADWLRAEPTGQYARRAGFFYEWLTGREVPIENGVARGNYVEALHPEDQLVATSSVTVSRWRVRDNMPGTKDFCPTVRLGPAVREALQFDLAGALGREEAEFGAEVLRRSAVWMTLRESRSSFQIEGEQDQVTRVQRFAAVMETRTGAGDAPLTPDALATLQKDILGDVTTLASFGLRRSPVFVGQAVHFENVVHYVAPDWPDVAPMLEGLKTFIERTTGASPTARAAVASFGFVFIHPLADGNGRVHRFLVNDVLRRDGAIHAPFIIPISALITEHSVERARYDAALEAFSRPLMDRYADRYRFTREPQEQPDGVLSNFQFDAYADARPAWRFPDLTSQVEYTAGLLQRTIQQEMHAQAFVFRSIDQARSAVKELIEGPDADIDAIVRSARENDGVRSGKLAKRFPALQNDALWAKVASAVSDAFTAEKPQPDEAADDPPSRPPIG
ncbi:Fic family protein [Variovorax sp. JS1663]|uniref:Fic family protein n=1 Tax=Variovorax sp. JS1663 TaxID=1851577 RepID=UPI000B71C25A|nr:Fic family protein [Variovorax sp. JS1663]OUL98721.1 cell filamentation protein Fic [Variovorax sp. JS1663]